MPRGNSSFNEAYISSRYKAYDPDGNFVEVVALTNDRKRRYEERGYTFKRTQLRVGDQIGSQHK